jgi:hypothetical protein
LFKPGHHKVKDGIPKYGAIRKCPTCHEEFSKKGNGKYCSRRCYWKVRGTAYDPQSSYRGGGPRKDRSEFRVVNSPRIQRLYLLKQVSACERCGWGEHKEVLEMHHKNENKKDGRRENLELICPNCHEVEHYLNKTGKYDANRYARATETRKRFGLAVLPSGASRTTLQQIMDSESARLDANFNRRTS